MIPCIPRFPLTAAAKARWNVLPNSGTILGGDGVWQPTADKSPARWTIDEAGYARSTTWDPAEGALTTALFSAATVTPSNRTTPIEVRTPAGVYVDAKGLEFGTSPTGFLLARDPSYGTGGVALPATSQISVAGGELAEINCDLKRIGGGLLALEKVGAGALTFSQTGTTMPGFTQFKVSEGVVSTTTYNSQSAIANAPAMVVSAGAYLAFHSASDVNLTGTLTGAGVIEIFGGGHLKYQGRDVNQRPLQTISGWTGSFLSPAVNAAPVITSNFPAQYAQSGVQQTYSITATDADQDSLTLSGSATSGSVSISGMNLLYTPSATGSQAVSYAVSDGHGGTANGTIPVFVWASGSAGGLFIPRYTYPTVLVGPTSLSLPSSSDTYTIALAGWGATVGGDTGSHFRSAVSGAGTVSVTALSTPAAFNIQGTSPSFTGTWSLGADVNFVCAGPMTGGLDGTPARYVLGANFVANPGPSTIHASGSGRITFGGLASGSSTISANCITGSSYSAGIHFCAGTYTCTGTSYLCSRLQAFDARVTFSNAVPVAGQLDLSWYPPGGGQSPRITLPANPNLTGVPGYSGWTRYVQWVDYTSGATAGTYLLVSWTGTMPGKLVPYDSQYFMFPNRYTVTTVNGVTTYERAGWGKFVFDPAGSYTLVKY